MKGLEIRALGGWEPGGEPLSFDGPGLVRAAHRLRDTAHVVRDGVSGGVGVGFGGRMVSSDVPVSAGQQPLVASLPPLYPEWLGDRSFCETHSIRFPYVSGAMANGIATTRLVIAMARSGMLGFFGAAGLSLEQIEAAVTELETTLSPDGLTWGSNLIHSPQEPDLEAGVVDLYLRRGVRRVSASAYMALTAPVVRYSASGLSRGPDGAIVRANHLFAKISRPEVARRFLAPAPAEILDGLVAAGQLTAAEAALAREVPVAEDLIVESDSGGHTDRQPLGALFPTIATERDAAMVTHSYTRPIRLGAAGGLGTPASLAAAFGLGAAFVLTGSVNQAAVESGLSEAGRVMLAGAELADVMMAPAADMFEMGVKVQVLKRGTLFAVRGAKLYEAYSRYGGLDEIPEETRGRLERDVFQAPLSQIWDETRAYWADRDPREVARADGDPKHQMALCFRAYLGLASRWAIAGNEDRRADYQIWCGPAMGAFNDWARGTFLEDPNERSVVQIALNLLEGAAVLTRAHQLRSYGAPMPAAAFQFVPRRLALEAGASS
jgi:trans-AT polyketide synthase/acyltransferase/oxidoreductase domain-containing protein